MEKLGGTCSIIFFFEGVRNFGERGRERGVFRRALLLPILPSSAEREVGACGAGPASLTEFAGGCEGSKVGDEGVGSLGSGPLGPIVRN